jgi:Family of unknown function (DUF6282)
MIITKWKRAWSLCAVFGLAAVALVTTSNQAARAQTQGAGAQGGRGEGGGRGRANYSLSDPVPQDPALQGAIDMHAHQDPDSNGPSYGQAARSDDAIDLVKRAKAAGMRGFVIKQHLDQTAGLAYYIRKLYPDMEVFGGMGSNLTTGPKVNPWAITHMTEIKGGWGRIVWMPSWDSETSSHKVRNFKQPAFVSVARCGNGGLFWANFPKPCDNGELLPEVKEAIRVIGTAKTRDSNGDLVLATGHNSPEEVLMMIREAVRAGVKHVIITHPLLDVVDMTDAQIKEAVGLGPEIYAEFTSQFGNPNASPEILKRYASAIRAAGVEHSFVSSDTGQVGSMFQPDALAACAKALRSQGFTERDLDQLLKINPARILGIPPPAAATR